MNINRLSRFAGLFLLLGTLGLIPPVEADGESGQEGLSPQWTAEVQAEIATREYLISWAETPGDGGPPCYQAPNRSQNLRFHFRNDGEISIIDRTEVPRQWAVRIMPEKAGRKLSGHELDKPLFQLDGNEAIYRYRGVSLTFSNRPEGLVQEIRFERKPDAPGLLEFEESIDGASIHRNTLGNLEIEAGGNRVLEIRALEAVDAEGRNLSLSLSASRNGQSLVFSVDDTEALFPLTVKAMIALPTAADWTILGEAENINLGFSVASAGDINGDGLSDVVIGSPNFDCNGYTNAGEVDLYYGNLSGLGTGPDWSYQGGGDWWELGHVAVTAGDVNGDGYADLAIGIPGYSVMIGPDLITMGAIMVFHGSSTGLPAQADWDRTGPDPQNNSGFGFAIAAAGDVNGDGYSDLLFSEPFYDDSGPTPATDSGTAYLRYGTATGLGDGDEWYFYGDNWDDGQSGYALSTAGDINNDGYSDFVITQPTYSSVDHVECGRAVVFLGSSSGPQATSYQLIGTQDNAHLGMAVSTAGDVNGDGFSDIIVGVPDYTTTNGHEGVAYLYYGASSFDTTSDWFAFGETQNGNFAASLSFAGDVNGDGYADIVIGEPGFTGTLSAEGRALMWLGSAAGPALGTGGNADWTTSSATAGAHYGSSVATAGDVNGDGYADIIVGAPDYTFNYNEEGAAFAFYGGADHPSGIAGWGIESNWTNADLGFSVGAAGDVNGDGYADIIVGAPYYDSTFSNEGAVLLYLGSAQGPGTVSDWFARGGQGDVNFGFVATSAGDINGDGFSDVIIGAPYYDYSAVDSGAVFVFLGSGSGMGNDGSPANADWFGISAYGGGLMGYSASTAGDVNGDGYADIVGGAPAFSESYSAEGGVFVWYGSATGLGDTGDPFNADWQYYGGEANKSLGTSVAPAGDVNGDGYADLLAGGLNLAVVWHGSDSGLKSDGISWGSTQSDVSFLFGRSVAGAGDINGDGFSDIVVGAPSYQQYFANEGAAWAYCGSATGLSVSPCWWDTGYLEDAYFGMSVASAGDLNGDGYTEIAVGAPGWSNGQSNEGQARLYFGSSSAPISYNNGDWTVESNYGDASLGRSVVGPGDVNGDGYGDLLIGLPGYSNDQTEEGRIQLYYGNGRKGITLLPRQLQVDEISPLAPLGRSSSETGFALKIRVRSAAGRGSFRLVGEVQQRGTPFNAGNFQTASAVGGTTISHVVTGLTKDTGYHWRLCVENTSAGLPLSPRYSRWIYGSYNGAEETDLRTAGVTDPAPSPIFSDGFETGTLGAWTSHTP